MSTFSQLLCPILAQCNPQPVLASGNSPVQKKANKKANKTNREIAKQIGRVVNWLYLRQRVLSRAEVISKAISGMCKMKTADIARYFEKKIGSFIENDEQYIKAFCAVWSEIACSWGNEAREANVTVHGLSCGVPGESVKLTPDIFIKLLFENDPLKENQSEKDEYLNKARVSLRMSYIRGALELLFKIFILREGTIRFLEACGGSVIDSVFNNVNNAKCARKVKPLPIPYSTGIFRYICVDKEKNQEGDKITVGVKNTAEDISKVLGLRKARHFSIYFAILKSLGLLLVRLKHKLNDGHYDSVSTLQITQLGRRVLTAFFLGENGLAKADEKLAKQYKQGYYALCAQRKKFYSRKKQDREDDAKTFIQVRGYGQYGGEYIERLIVRCITPRDHVAEHETLTSSECLNTICEKSRDDLDVINNIKELVRKEIIRTNKTHRVNKDCQVIQKEYSGKRICITKPEYSVIRVDPPLTERQVDPPLSADGKKLFGYGRDFIVKKGVSVMQARKNILKSAETDAERVELLKARFRKMQERYEKFGH